MSGSGTGGLSGCVTKLQMLVKYSVAMKIIVGTGFFWEVNGKLFIATNWHNVSGINPLTGSSLSNTAARPAHIETSFLCREEKVEGGFMVRRHFVEVPLYDGDVPIWVEHPTHGHSADVVLVPVNPPKGDLLSQPLNKNEEIFKLPFEPGDDAFVIGFPEGMSGDGDFPIWKRASIATHPNLLMNANPKLLIDTATRPGMSGSPVIVRKRGIVTPLDAASPSDDTMFSGNTIIGQADGLLGIYSGRIGDDALGFQLGTVWRRELLDEISESLSH